MAVKKEVMGIFQYVDDVVDAINALKEKKHRIKMVYSPVPNSEIRDAMGLSVMSPVRFLTLTGAILGVLTGIGLAVYSSITWHFMVGAKPVIPTVPIVIPAFEFCILLGVLFNISGWILSSRLPSLKLPDNYDPRFSEDRFGIEVICNEEEREEVANTLREHGAEEVHESIG